MRPLVILIVAAAMLPQVAAGGTWVGPDVLNNDWSTWSISGAGSVMKSRVSPTLQLGTFNYTVFNMSYSATGTASLAVPLTAGKRYQYQVTGKITKSIVAQPVSSNWWTEITGVGSTPPSTSSNYSTQTITTVAGGSSLTLRARSTLSGAPVGQCNYCYGEFSTATLSQVVYDPQLAVSDHQIRMNTDSRGGAGGTVSLGLNSLSYADDPTAWSVDLGDGTVENNPGLNSTRTHAFSLAGGDSQSWTATFSGSNQAGSASDAASITLLRQPEIALAVNGALVENGGTILLDVAKNPVPEPVAPSVGRIY